MVIGMFEVNEKAKIEVINLVIQNNKGLRRLAKCAKWVLPFTAVLAAVHVCLYFLVPELGVVVVAGVPTKESLPIISRTILLLLFGFIARYCLKLFLVNRSSKDLTERTEEKLCIEDNELRYIFRTRYVTAPNNRIIIVIPLRGITSVKYDVRTRRIELEGRIFSDVIENYDPRRHYTPNQGNLKNLVVYDYFTPSLLDSLHENGIH